MIKHLESSKCREREREFVSPIGVRLGVMFSIKHKDRMRVGVLIHAAATDSYFPSILFTQWHWYLKIKWIDIVILPAITKWPLHSEPEVQVDFAFAQCSSLWLGHKWHVWKHFRIPLIWTCFCWHWEQRHWLFKQSETERNWGGEKWVVWSK